MVGVELIVQTVIGVKFQSANITLIQKNDFQTCRIRKFDRNCSLADWPWLASLTLSCFENVRKSIRKFILTMFVN